MSEDDSTSYPELLKINVDFSCRGKKCEDCGKFFECEYPQKEKFHDRGRFGKIQSQMGNIKYKIAVLSGKGGVGKSTLSANLAAAFAMKKKSTSIVDSDFYGPSIPKILGVTGKKMKMGREGIIPVESPLNIKVISTGLVVEDDEAVTWFHELKRGALEGFLAHVDYGKTDYLIIDLPPGTGSESYNLMQCVPSLSGAIVVTVPSEVSQEVARRSVSLCLVAKIPVIGIIENMSGFVCPDCGEVSYILSQGGGEKLAEETGVPFLGRIPLDQRVSEASDNGIPFIAQFPEAPVSRSFLDIVGKIEEILKG